MRKPLLVMFLYALWRDIPLDVRYVVAVGWIQGVSIRLMA